MIFCAYRSPYGCYPILKGLLIGALLIVTSACRKTESNPAAVQAPAGAGSAVSRHAVPAVWVPIPAGTRVRAGTVSHHLLAYDWIDRFFADTAANTTPSRIVILSPRHFKRGSGLVAVSRHPWVEYHNRPEMATANKQTEATNPVDDTLVDTLIAAGAVEDDESFQGEHGIGALIPFIAKYWPGVPIVPVVLEIDERRPDALVPLADLLIQEMTCDPDLFLLLSVDFSHHEGLERTRERDARSRPALEELSFDSHWHIYSDNASGFYILSRILDHFGWNRGHIAAYTSGQELAGIVEDITSYFFVWWPAPR